MPYFITFQRIVWSINALSARNLEDMITGCRKALTVCPPGHPDRSYSLNNIANAVLTRYQQLGRMEDLEEVITYHREALTLRPPGHPHRSDSLHNLAIAVLTRYRQLGRMEDLEEVITYNLSVSLLLLPSLGRLALLALQSVQSSAAPLGRYIGSSLRCDV